MNLLDMPIYVEGRTVRIQTQDGRRKPSTHWNFLNELQRFRDQEIEISFKINFIEDTFNLFHHLYIVNRDLHRLLCTSYEQLIK